MPVHAVSGRTGAGLDALASLTDGYRTIALLGASGVGKSTLVNALVGRDVQDTGTVREGDDRGRHTTTAAELIPLPGGGWLIDTPGLRAVSLWASGEGIERAFQDVFDLAEHCRFRDCKHEDEPGCAVLDAVAAGRLDPRRVQSLTRLVAEEAALEEEQRQRVRASDRRGVRPRSPLTRPSQAGALAGRRPAALPARRRAVRVAGPRGRLVGRRGGRRSTLPAWTSPSPIAASTTGTASSRSWTSASTRTRRATTTRSPRAATPTISRRSWRSSRPTLGSAGCGTSSSPTRSGVPA